MTYPPSTSTPWKEGWAFMTGLQYSPLHVTEFCEEMWLTAVCETKPTKTKPSETKPTNTKPNKTKPTKTKPNETKPTKTKPNETKPNKTKPNQNETKPKIDERNWNITLLCCYYTLLSIIVPWSVVWGLRFRGLCFRDTQHDFRCFLTGA